MAIGLFAVALAVVLGALAGTQVGAGAGVLAALAGLVPPAVLAVAVERRQRNIAQMKRQQEVLRRFAPPKPTRNPEGPTNDKEGERVKAGEHSGLAVARYLRPEEAVVPFRPARSWMSCCAGVSPEAMRRCD